LTFWLASLAQPPLFADEPGPPNERLILQVEAGGGLITTVRLCPGDPAGRNDRGPLTNGDFENGLNGWTPAVAGGGAAPGQILPDGGQALFLEGDSFLVTLEQTFTMPAGTAALTFDVLFEPGFDLADDFIPDAFEAQLLDDANQSVVPTWHPLATSFWNAQEDLTFNMGSGATFDGLTVRVDVSAVPAGMDVTLFFDLIGADRDTGSGVRIDNVRIEAANAPPTCDAGGP